MSPMTQQYLIGEFSLRLARVRDAAGQTQRTYLTRPSKERPDRG